jgi:hypothetical protein
MNQPPAPQKHPDIAMQPVKSSQVSAIGHDPETNTLAVQFTRGSGQIYHYPNVTPEDHQAFLNAPSIGKHFGAHIKKLPFVKPPMEPKGDKDAPAPKP